MLSLHPTNNLTQQELILEILNFFPDLINE